jgi:hypothetical protein
MVSKALATFRETAPVSLLSSKFLLTLSTRLAGCCVVLSGSEPELLVMQEATLVCFSKDPSE